MRLLLDASALIPLLIDHGEKLLDIATEVSLHITDLTIYEVGNSLWKLTALLRTVSIEDAMELMEILTTVIRGKLVMIVHFNKLDLSRALRLALTERITFYDASYIVATEEINATLVTEDRKLKEKARKHINVITYDDLKAKLKSA